MTETILTPEIMDFSKARPPIRFRIDDDVFAAVPALPADTALIIAGTGERIAVVKGEDRLRLFHELFELLLAPESARRFVARMSSADNPIDSDQIARIMPWLMEQFGLRPTTPSADSLGTSLNPADGTSSTVNSPPAG